MERCRIHLSAVKGGHPDRPGSQLGDLIVLEHEEVAGEPEDRRDVRGQEGGVVGNPHQQRRDPPGGHDEIGLVGVDHRKGEGPPDAPECGPHRAGQAGPRIGRQP